MIDQPDPVFFNEVGTADPIEHPHGNWDWQHPETMPKGWYHSDETWADCYGPYATREAAQKALDYYVRTDRMPVNTKSLTPADASRLVVFARIAVSDHKVDSAATGLGAVLYGQINRTLECMEPFARRISEVMLNLPSSKSLRRSEERYAAEMAKRYLDWAKEQHGCRS